MQRHQAAAVVIGFALCGLFWSVLFAAIRALLALGTVKPRPTFAVHYLGKDAREFQDGDLEPDITIAHLSDCHLTKSEDVLTTERHPGGIGALNRILHNKRDKLLGTDAVVLSGDAVDSGHALEWSHLFRLLREYSLVERVYLIPGNHELNIPEAQSRGRQMTASMLRIRRIRFLGAMRDSAAAVCKCFDGTAEKTIGDLFDRHNDFLQETIVWLDVEFPLLYVGSSGDEKAQVELAMKKQQIDERLQQIWEAAFPYWQPLSNGLLLIALDSNCFSTNLASNAFGEVSASQLTKLRQLGEQFPHCRPLIAMHHHPIDPTHRATLFPIEDKFLGLTNSVEFFSTIVNSFAIDPIIINGHRHMDVASRVSVSNGSSEGSAVIDVYASPSSTFGRSQDEGSPGFYVLGFSDLEDRVRLISRVWNRCCGEPEDRARGTERSTL
jgi:predicted MPP superfamily phosphohydrolase